MGAVNTTERKDDLKKVRNLGPKCCEEIKELLKNTIFNY
ncbi:DNA-directed RNA polymerase subunit alpha C-terminal domain-containing protein [Anaerobutyricum hallii]